MLLGIFSWIGTFFEDLFNLIPKIIYFLYASFISILDVLQLAFRKLAGLDVYYVNGNKVTGDLVTNFISGILGIQIGDSGDTMTYSSLSTVFWSFVIFGLIILFLATLIAIVKQHYSYDEKSAKGPTVVLAAAGKAVLNMVAVPIMVVLGLYLSQAILTALDDITSTGASDIVSLYGTDGVKYLQSSTDSRGDKTYTYYDFFGYTGNVIFGNFVSDVPSAEKVALVAATSQPFSGSVFKVAGYNANRVRSKGDGWNYSNTNTFSCESTLFSKGTDDVETLAEMVDTAFANFLHLNYVETLSYDSNGWIRAESYFTNFTAYKFTSFSKFNTGLVWYYYNLWEFNYIVGFGAGIVCVTIFINVIIGLMTRLFLAIVLFLIMPPLVGLSPMDGGKAFKGWREEFVKQVLMAYGAVVGMNLVMIILPYINQIDFFNISIADYFMQTLFIIVGLITIKQAIALISQLIGGADANKTGGDIKEEVGDTMGKATKMTVGAAKLGGKAFGATAKLGAAAAGGAVKLGASLTDKVTGGRTHARDAVDSAGKKIGEAKAKVGEGLSTAGRMGSAFLKGGVKGAKAEAGIMNEQKGQKEQQEIVQNAAKDKFIEDFAGSGKSTTELTKEAQKLGLNAQQTRNLVTSVATATDASGARTAYETFDRGYRDFSAANSHDHTLMQQSGAASMLNLQASHENIDKYRQAQIDAANNPGALRGALNVIPQIGGTMLGNYGTFLKSDKGVKAFKDGIIPPPNYDKITAQATQATQKQMEGLHRELNEIRDRLPPPTP